MKKDENKKNKIILEAMYAIIVIALLFYIISTMLVALYVPSEALQGIFISVLSVIFIVVCCYAIKFDLYIGHYKCPDCGCEIVPKYIKLLLSAHAGSTRYLECPRCHNKNWCKKEM